MRTVRITVDLWQPAFHGLDDRGGPEWPPSPFRLAQALMAGCHQPDVDGEARSALEALTALENPIIEAPTSTQARLPGTYTHRSGGPMEDKELGGAGLARVLDLSWAGLSTTNRTEKPQSCTLVDDCRLVYVVADPEGSVDAEALDRAARRVPYLGRSHDGCDLSVVASDGDGSGQPTGAGHVRLVPSARSDGRTRGWSARSCAWMDHNHHLTASGSQLRFSAEPYIARLRYAPASQAAPAARRSVVVVLPTRDPVPGPRVSALLRDLGPLPIRVFPCVVAGHPRADGRMRGVGLVAEAGSSLAERLPEIALTLRQHSSFQDAEALGIRVLDPERWQRDATHWSSATPLRAFPDDRVARELVAREAEELTGMRPMVDVSPTPTRAWQQPWPQPPDGLGLWWVELEFPSVVQGPLILGRTQEEGFGLFVQQGVRS